MNAENKNKILETIFVIIMSTIFMVLGIYYFQGIIFLYPVLFIMLGSRYGLKCTVISLVVSSLSIGLMTDMISGMLVLSIFAPLSIAIIYTMKKRKSSTEVLAISTLVFLASILIMVNFIGNIIDINIISQVEETFTESINFYIEVLQESEFSNYEILQVRDFMENAFQYGLLILPSMIIILSLVVAYLNYLISSLSLRKLGHGIVHIPRFSRFKLPNNILVGTGIMFLGALILRYFGMAYSESVFTNLVVLVSFVFFIQGLSVIDHKLVKKKINIIIRILIISFVIMLMPIGGVITTIIGLLDVIIDFRKFRRSI